MLSGTLALTSRSLRLDARLLRSHLFRLLFVVIILFALATAHLWSLSVGAPGLYFFNQMAWLNFAFITLAAVSFFATSITEEKEEDTLGLLKMAGINAASILLGKSAPRLASALLLLSVQFPFTLLAITLGGVTMHQVWATYAGLLAYMFLAANLGLFCSVVQPRSGSAASMSVMLLFLYLGAVPFARAMLQLSIAGKTINSAHPLMAAILPALDALYSSSIAVRLFSSIMLTGFGESILSLQVISNLLAGCVLFGLAWLVFDVFTREQKPVTPQRTWTFRRTSRLGKLGITRAWQTAVVWKDFYFVTGGLTFLIVKLIAYPAIAVPIYLLLFEPRRKFVLKDFGEFAMGVTVVGMILETSIFASRIFHEEVKWRTLPALMMLPYSTARIAYSKVIGCLLSLAPALLYFAIASRLARYEFSDAIDQFGRTPAAWFGVLQFLVFLHLTAYLSLTIKWGALPLAFGIVYISFMCCLQPVFALSVVAGTGEGLWGFFSFVELVIIAALHPLIGHKLQEQAAK